MSNWLFETRDKDGALVRLDDGRWSMHIASKHPEVKAHLQEIQEVIGSPGIITKDLGDVHHLSRLGAIRQRPNLYLEVVVRYDDQSDPVVGEVMTVFVTSTIPKGVLL